MTLWPVWTYKPDGEEVTHYRDVVIALQRLENGRVRLQVRTAREDGGPPCIDPFAYDFTGAEQARKFARDMIRGAES